MTIYHKHHITPKHMGGTDDPSNLVTVTVEQHAALHKQLWEDLGHEEDRIAWLCLSGQISNAEAIILAVKKANTGRKWTEEEKNIRSEKYKGKNNPFYGKSHSSEVKKQISKKNKNRVYSEKTRKEFSIRMMGKNNPFYGKTHSNDFKKKMSEIQKGRKQTEEHKQQAMKSMMTKKICSHCNKAFNAGNFSQHISSLRKRGIKCY